MSKLIDKNADHGFQRWELPVVEDISAAVGELKDDTVAHLPTAEQIERIQEQAYKEAYDTGFAKGLAEGRASGQAEIKAKIGMLDSLLHDLQAPFENLDEEVEQQLVSLAITVAQALVRRELKLDPGQVVAVVQEALAALPVASRKVRIYLHPEDVSVVNDALTASEGERDWRLHSDPALNRGDCRVLSDNSRIDATMDRRLKALVSQLLGGEREQDSNDDEAE
jgi:flagellar assembly protein FliH